MRRGRDGHALAGSYLLASRATSLGRLRLAPHPSRRGSLAALLRRTTRAAEAPCASGRATARRIRSRRLPAAPHPPAPPSRCATKLFRPCSRVMAAIDQRAAVGGGGASPVDPYLLRVAEAEDRSLVAR